MAFIVEMINVGSNKIQARYSMWRWREFLKIARQNGWKAHGSVREDQLENENAERGDYEPDSWGWHSLKTITAEDALNLAHALERANLKAKKAQRVSGVAVDSREKTLLSEGLSEDQYKTSDVLVPLKFIEFLRQGAFVFVYDD